MKILLRSAGAVWWMALLGLVALSSVSAQDQDAPRLGIALDQFAIVAGLPVPDEDVFVVDAGQTLLYELRESGLSGVAPSAIAEDRFGRLYFVPTLATTSKVGLPVGPRDVLKRVGDQALVIFNGAAHGVPLGTKIDALAIGLEGELVMSFDGAVSLAHGLANDEDLVTLRDDELVIFFDASSFGFDTSLDLDAADFLSEEALLVSFDQFGTTVGINHRDDELVVVGLESGQVSLLESNLAILIPQEADLEGLSVVRSALQADDFESGSLERWASTGN